MSPRDDMYTCHGAHVCVHVCAQRVISGLNIHSRFLLTRYMDFSYIPVESRLFLSCGTIFVFISSHVMWRNWTGSIRALNRSR